MKKSEFTEKRKKISAKTIDELVKLLASEDLQMRFFAEMSLRDQTGI